MEIKLERYIFAYEYLSNIEIIYSEAIECWKVTGTIYQPLRSGRIWHKVNF